ncbi:MAG: MAPEG family protein [Flavobacteriaceae bacterium]
MSLIAAMAWSAILLWLMIVVAGVWKYTAWTPSGLKKMMSNRDEVVAISPANARAERAARNMLENIVVFIALAAAAGLSGRAAGMAETGATIFFWARLIYWPVYVAGIVYARTALWAVSIVGLAMIALALL